MCYMKENTKELILNSWWIITALFLKYVSSLNDAVHLHEKKHYIE